MAVKRNSSTHHMAMQTMLTVNPCNVTIWEADQFIWHFGFTFPAEIFMAFGTKELGSSISYSKIRKSAGKI